MRGRQTFPRGLLELGTTTALQPYRAWTSGGERRWYGPEGELMKREMEMGRDKIKERNGCLTFTSLPFISLVRSVLFVDEWM